MVITGKSPFSVSLQSHAGLYNDCLISRIATKSLYDLKIYYLKQQQQNLNCWQVKHSD